MKHEMIQWKCFVPDTPSFCDHMASCGALQENFSHKMTLVNYRTLTLSSDYMSPNRKTPLMLTFNIILARKLDVFRNIIWNCCDLFWCMMILNNISRFVTN